MSSTGRKASYRVVVVSAEATHVARVGGLADATTGLVSSLRSQDVDTHLVVPDYGGVTLLDEVREPLPVPAWARPAFARHGWRPGIGQVTLVSTPSLTRSHPYVDPSTGAGWPDNDERFLEFSAAAAALIELDPPDIVQLNDWHAAAVTSWLDPTTTTVLTIHNLAHQGETALAKLGRLGPRNTAYAHDGQVNLLAGAISMADLVCTVSPSYAAEIVENGKGNGLEALLRSRGSSLIGILNGLDLEEWCPSLNVRLPAAFDSSDLSGKLQCRRRLLARAGLEPADDKPVIGMVARLAEQKGVDIALDLVPLFAALGATLVLIGDGDPGLAGAARDAERRHPQTVRALPFDDRLAHLTVAGSDLLLMPSRFEPCGLPQMQAMLNGTLPVVTRVGGLRDTVIDADERPTRGTGFVASHPTAVSVADAVARAVRAWHDPKRRRAIQCRAMTSDWSWHDPTRRLIERHRRLIGLVN